MFSFIFGCIVGIWLYKKFAPVQKVFNGGITTVKRLVAKLNSPPVVLHHLMWREQSYSYVVQKTTMGATYYYDFSDNKWWWKVYPGSYTSKKIATYFVKNNGSLYVEVGE